MRLIKFFREKRRSETTYRGSLKKQNRELAIELCNAQAEIVGLNAALIQEREDRHGLEMLLHRMERKNDSLRRSNQRLGKLLEDKSLECATLTREVARGSQGIAPPSTDDRIKYLKDIFDKG